MIMETKFNFNSQVCTDRVQSERLLALGLKKETADMKWLGCSDENGDIYYMLSDVPHHFRSTDIPAWSLHRLIEMIGDMFEMQHWLGFNIEKDYDHTIDCIEWLIEDNRFNKEYLL